MCGVKVGVCEGGECVKMVSVWSEGGECVEC